MNYETDSILSAVGLHRELSCHIGGFWLPFDASRVDLVEDPASGAVIAEVLSGGPGEVDQAVRAASRAFEHAWSTVPPADRARVLADMSEALLGSVEPIARLESLDTGKPLSQARGDVVMAARYFEFFAGAADKIHGESLWAARADVAYTVREPFGVVAQIIPWNSPIAQLARGVAPALAAGNTVVVKPSELAPLTTLAVAQMFTETGLPPGVFNVVTGIGKVAGEALARHGLVRQITFTGSVATARSVLISSADHIVPCTLELGGKSPTLVFPDADLAAAAKAAVDAVRRNSGQSCSATTRILVQREVYEDVLQRIVSGCSALTLGPGLHDPDLGPLISAAQLERAVNLIETTRMEGATVAFGGSRPLDAALSHGHFLQPTVLSNVTNSMAGARAEIFGPVQSVIPFSDEDDAIAMANDTEYGLSAAVFTSDFSRAHRVARRLEAGQVHINEYPIDSVETPFGGMKSSGIGREKGIQALDAYTQVKTILARVPVDTTTTAQR